MTAQDEAGPRILGVMAFCNKTQCGFAQLVTELERPPTADHPRVAEHLSSIREAVGKIEDLCREQEGLPGQLPTPSRRAYQWLKFLSEPEPLVQHLTALGATVAGARALPARKSLPAALQKAPLHLEFFYTSFLYRVTSQSDLIQVTLHEGFVGAPPAVLTALLLAALDGRSAADREKVRAYSVSAPFVGLVQALETPISDVDEPLGRWVNLVDVFTRVNARYFAGSLTPPHLRWSRSPTYRTLGHYNYLTDTVVISALLDASDIPAYALDFVMYHELLHKALGVTAMNGRRRAHTTAFRRAEREFVEYEKAKAFLQTLTPEGRDLFDARL